MTKTVVLVSGGGANLQPLLDAAAAGDLPGTELTAVISSADGVGALDRARAAGVPVYLVERALFPGAASFSAALLDKLRDLDAELVVCAGFAERLSYSLLRQFRSRVIGVQPALFPAFCTHGERFDAVRAVEETLRAGARITGATAYFFGEEDTGFGPVIVQQAVAVRPDDTPASLGERVMRLGEQPALTAAVRLFCAGRLRVEGGRVLIGE